MKNLDDNDVVFCSDGYNYVSVGSMPDESGKDREIFRVCSYLIKSVRDDFAKIVSQKGGFLSDGLCEAHEKQARWQMKKDLRPTQS